MRVAVNVAFLYRELPYLERFAAVGQAGFRAVELPWPRHDLDAVANAVRGAGLELVQLNADAGDLDAGDRGFANDPSRVDEWRDAVSAAIEWGSALGQPACNLLVGNRLPGVELARQHATMRDNLAWALGLAHLADVQLLVEMLNDRDTPDYLLTSLDETANLIRSFGDPRLALQFDSYHASTKHGPLVPAFHQVAELVGHVQLADVPGRNEPGAGEADIAGLLRALTASGYTGAVSLEYVPSTSTEDSLRWMPVPARSAASVSVDDLRL